MAGPLRTRFQLFLRRRLAYRGRKLEITKAGWNFIVLTLMVGFAAINSGANLLHLVFGCQLGLIIASGVLSEAIVQRAKVQRRLTSPLHAQGVASLEIRLHNRGIRPMFSLSVEADPYREDGTPSDPAKDGEMSPVFSTALGGRKDRVMHAQVGLPRRGQHPLPPAVVATRFPFGLFVKRKVIEGEAPVLVYPRVHPLSTEELDLSRRGEGELAGRISRAGEFHGLEEAREGTELRRIHWPASARLGRMVVCEYEAQGEREWVLELAPGRSGEQGFEQRVEDVASMTVALLREGRVATGLRYGGELVVPPGLGPGHEARILGFLALAGGDATPPTRTEAQEHQPTRAPDALPQGAAA